MVFMVFLDKIPLNNHISMIPYDKAEKWDRNRLKIDEIKKLLVKKDAFCATESAKFSKKLIFCPEM